jgi:hypothetical protein
MAPHGRESAGADIPPFLKLVKEDTPDPVGVSDQSGQKPQISRTLFSGNRVLRYRPAVWTHILHGPTDEGEVVLDVRPSVSFAVHHQYHYLVNEFESMVNILLPAPPELTSYSDGLIIYDRHDLIVEKLMSAYGVTTYVELALDRSQSATINGPLNVMLPLMQPEAAIAVQPEADDDDHVNDGLFESYRSTGVNLSTLLEAVRNDHSGPIQYSAIASRLKSDNLVEYVRSLVAMATDNDVIVMYDLLEQQYTALLKTILTAVGETKQNWSLYQLFYRHLLVKSSSLNAAKSTPVPPLPLCSNGSTKKTLSRSDSVDIVLMSKNRPLQARSPKNCYTML